MKEVTCLCGWQVRGSLDEVVDQVIRHGREVHGIESSRDEILALVVDVPETSRNPDDARA